MEETIKTVQLKPDVHKELKAHIKREGGHISSMVDRLVREGLAMRKVKT
jgi:hypothetical protein